MIGVIGHTRYPTSSRTVDKKPLRLNHISLCRFCSNFLCWWAFEFRIMLLLWNQVEAELHPHCWLPHGRSTLSWVDPSSTSPPDHDLDANDATTVSAVHALSRPDPLSMRGVWLCHNGDFDEFELFGSRVSNALVGRWLKNVLHHNNACKAKLYVVSHGPSNFICHPVRTRFPCFSAPSVRTEANSRHSLRCRFPGIM